MDQRSFPIPEPVDEAPNVELIAQNLENLDTFTARTYLPPNYLAKLQQWIAKAKYKLRETPTSLHVSCQIFEFTLIKCDQSEESQTKLIRRELGSLKQD